MMALIPAWAWRWISILLVLVGAFAAGAAKMHEHDERVFGEYKAQVKAAGDKQNALTQATIKAHQQLKEISDAEASTAAAQRDAALLRVRALSAALAGQRIVPPSAAGAAGGDKFCASADQLDRGIREALRTATERLNIIAQEGERGIDTAVVCRDWAKGLR